MSEEEYEEIIVGRDYSRIAYFLLAAGLVSGGIYLYKNFKPIRTEKRIITETIKKELVTRRIDSAEKELPYKQQIVVYFGYNQYILSARERKKLDNLPEVIKEIAVYGYADSDGSEEYNKKLSLKRIEHTLQTIIKKHPNLKNIDISPMGEKELIIEEGRENKAKSRRVEIKVR